MIPSLRRRCAAALVGSVVFVSAIPAFAEEPVETAIRSLVSTIDASPNWVAGFGELSYDAATQTATVRNLSIRTENVTIVPGGKLEVTFDRIDLKGFSQQPDGAFSFSELRVQDARALASGAPPAKAPATDTGTDVVDTPIRLDVRFGSISYKDASVPSFAGIVIDPATPVASWIRVMATAMKASVGPMEARNIVYDTEMQGEKTHSTIESYQSDGFKNGLVEKMTVGPMAQETPSPDGLVKMRIESMEVRGYDLDALLSVIDPDRYVGGVGDGKWRIAIALESLRNWSITIPGGEVRIGAYEVENVKVRQPPRSFPAALVLDELIANPNMEEEKVQKLILDNLPSLFNAFGFGALRLTDLDVVAPEIDRFHLGDFHINDLSSEGLGEIGIGDLDVSVQDKGSFGAERLAIGGFRFPSMDKIIAAIQADEAGSEVDPLPLIPTLGYGEAINLDLVQAGKKLGAVDRARFDLTDYIGPVPTKLALDLRGLDLDLSLVDDPKARKMLEGLGYDRLQADYGFKVNWREADQSLNLEDFKLAIKDVGSITADVALTGLTRATIENPMAAETALTSLLFSRGKVVVKDSSVVDRAIAMEAKKKNQTPEKFRDDIAGAVPLSLMLVLKNPTFQQKLAPALQAFIRTPGTMTLTAAPATPVPVLAILAAAENDPRSLPNLISLDVKSEKP
ncbi:hypothetical protein C3941_22385 [Kaistia algarum]|uniref:hypothetical protein n=1 Tax=Kaistia algarum TaxID=2083279 RepID=UPI000CE769F0|nr:hypothetical protein [Kaistia algarum]MCX5515284.1 hypothetical protein [Kaistia algarum]PPE77701.1 hypothetical protein C3941_22385 [Kaistia algarum]